MVPCIGREQGLSEKYGTGAPTGGAMPCMGRVQGLSGESGGSMLAGHWSPSAELAVGLKGLLVKGRRTMAVGCAIG